MAERKIREAIRGRPQGKLLQAAQMLKMPCYAGTILRQEIVEIFRRAYVSSFAGWGRKPKLHHPHLSPRQRVRMQFENATPLPSLEDRLLLSLHVPCLRDYKAYCQSHLDFLSLPTKLAGLELDSIKNGNFGKPQDQVEFLQGWLFFAFLNDVSQTCGVEFAPSELVISEPDGRQYISTVHLRKYIWFWTAAMYPKTIEERRAGLARFVEMMAIVNDVVNASVVSISTQTHTSLEVVLLSIMIVADALSEANQLIFNLGTHPLSITWVYPELTRTLLLNSGWCVGQLSLLYVRCTPIVLHYLTSIHCQRQNKDHSNCSSLHGCLANQLDMKTYQPSHAAACSGHHCEFVEAPSAAMTQILREGGVPLVCMQTDQASQSVTLVATKFVLGDHLQMPSYVAISHVWSDGMGNPDKKNALRLCQLVRIQEAVNQLQGSNGGQNHLFWMDTLCVPLQKDMRSFAISLMAKTFLHADKVLVFDNALETVSHDNDWRHVLVKIAVCDWNTRLWTLQEALLARECYFQLKGVAVSVDVYRDHVLLTKNLLEIYNILSTLGKEEILRNNQALHLAAALACTYGQSDALQLHYASLPPQEDPMEESLRLDALRIAKDYAYVREVSAQLGYLADDISQRCPDVEANYDLQTHLSAHNLDPVLDFALNTLFRIRGHFYELELDRAKDLEAGAHRQITAFKADANAGVLLVEVGPGLRGRYTSRVEDETICLGGMLGLDVSPILKTRVYDQSDAVEVQRVRIERMKTFLTLVAKFPDFLPFFPGPHLEEAGWGWAPLTFLHGKSFDIAAGGRSAAVTATARGLVANYFGLLLEMQDCGQGGMQSPHQPRPGNTRCDRSTVRITLSDQTEQNITSSRFHHSFISSGAYILTFSGSFHDFRSRSLFATAGKRYALVRSPPYPGSFGAILVEIIAKEDGILYSKYLAHAERVDSTSESEVFDCIGYPIDRTLWCIG